MKVVIVNRNVAATHALALLMEERDNVEVMAEVSDADEIIPSVTRTNPDLVLIDPELPQLDLKEVVDELQQLQSSVGVVVLTDSNEPEHLQDAVQSGARAYISMDTEPDELIHDLQLAADGQVLASGPAVDSLADLIPDTSSQDAQISRDLSGREIEVINLVARGDTNKEIAEVLVVTENTVKVHLRSIFRKLGVRNRQQVTAHALQSGLVQDIEST